MSRDGCDVKHLDRKKADELRKILFTEETVHDLAETFKVLGDPTRLKIILLLSKQ